MLATTPNRLSFSGHESFQCRSLWLKKGYDFIAAGRSFTAEDAVVELGVGKNMVNAICYWMAMVLYGLLTSGGFDLSVNFNTLLTAPDQVGSAFALNATGLYTKLENLVAANPKTMVFSDQAGIRELSFRTKPDPVSVLDTYYAG